MADCAKLEKCPFFHDRMSNMPGMAGIYKRRYCRGSNSGCARWLVHSMLGPAAVPADLFPNEWDRADAYIRTKGVAS